MGGTDLLLRDLEVETISFCDGSLPFLRVKLSVVNIDDGSPRPRCSTPEGAPCNDDNERPRRALLRRPRCRIRSRKVCETFVIAFDVPIS